MIVGVSPPPPPGHESCSLPCCGAALLSLCGDKLMRMRSRRMTAEQQATAKGRQAACRPQASHADRQLRALGNDARESYHLQPGFLAWRQSMLDRSIGRDRLFYNAAVLQFGSWSRHRLANISSEGCHSRLSPHNIRHWPGERLLLCGDRDFWMPLGPAASSRGLICRRRKVR